MKIIQVYEADDRSRWNTAEEAIERDFLIKKVELATAPLGVQDESTDFVNGKGYYQHSEVAIATTRRALWILTAPKLESWINTQKEKYGRSEEEIAALHPSGALRMLDGSHRPLEGAWTRFLCIDEQGREWGQPYYVNAHEHREEKRLNAE